jgi:hypothetical protein
VDERGTPEVIRLFPTFVRKSRLASDARATVQRAILEEVRAQRAGLTDPEAGQGLAVVNKGVHAMIPKSLFSDRCRDTTGASSAAFMSDTARNAVAFRPPVVLANTYLMFTRASPSSFATSPRVPGLSASSISRISSSSGCYP